jgi:regulator of protease activity HflC (stomatin/prohibitin superfamily)
MWQTFLFALGLGVFVVGFFSSIKVVPTAYYGVVERFGKRTGRLLDEGLHFVLPFGIDQVEILSYELKTEEVPLTVTSKDGIKIDVGGTIQYRPAKIGEKSNLRREKQLLLTFIEIPDKTIKEGLVGTIRDELGAIAGLCEAKEFIENREALGLLINSVLRLENVPHLATNPPVVPGKRLDFYKDNHPAITKRLKDEGTIGSNSAIEHLYGIDIARFTISKVTFDTLYQQALEAQKEAEKRVESLGKTTDGRIANIKKLIDAGLTAEQAAMAIDVIEGKATRTVSNIDVAGIKDLAVAILSRFVH